MNSSQCDMKFISRDISRGLQAPTSINEKNGGREHELNVFSCGVFEVVSLKNLKKRGLKSW